MRDDRTVTPAGPTVITDVTILPKKRHQRRGSAFAISLSHDGIEINRPGRRQQHLSWDRVSRWEIVEHVGYVVLTLRGDGAVTPLVVKGWTLDDLAMVMCEVTSDVGGSVPVRDTPPPPPPPPPPTPAPPPPDPTPGPEPHPAAAPADLAPDPPLEETPTSPESRVARRRRLQRTHRKARITWKAAVTVALLGVLVAAVAIVLLQSAGLIDWGFLGPT